MRIRESGPDDRDAVAVFLSSRGMRPVARLREVLDPVDHPALLAEEDGRPAGVATYVPGVERWELLALYARETRSGVGTALVEELERTATRAGARTLFLITTNDNLDALRFYQRRGFRLRALHAGQADWAREHLKPQIPTAGDHGIPLRDELELEKEL